MPIFTIENKPYHPIKIGRVPVLDPNFRLTHLVLSGLLGMPLEKRKRELINETLSTEDFLNYAREEFLKILQNQCYKKWQQPSSLEHSEHQIAKALSLLNPFFTTIQGNTDLTVLRYRENTGGQAVVINYELDPYYIFSRRHFQQFYDFISRLWTTLDDQSRDIVSETQILESRQKLAEELYIGAITYLKQYYGDHIFPNFPNGPSWKYDTFK